jgi:hypothetical protein
MVTGSSEKAAFARQTLESRVALWRENVDAKLQAWNFGRPVAFWNPPVVRI